MIVQSVVQSARQEFTSAVLFITLQVQQRRRYRGEGLEKVYLVAFGLDKVRKVPKNAETVKDTKGTVFAPSFLHASLVGGFGARRSRKNGKKSGYKRYTATRKWPPGLQKAQTFSRPRNQQVYLI